MQIGGSDLSHFERALRARSSVLRGEIRDRLLRSDSERYADIAGQAHDVEEEARDIDAALRRVATGAYGVCVR
jgi:RNA polymerase-binding transcription factor DksA